MRWIFVIALLFIGCLFNKNSDTSSTSSETDLYGFLVQKDSITPVLGAQVSLYKLKDSSKTNFLAKNRFNPSIPDSLILIGKDTSNETGRFRFNDLASDTYHLQAIYVDTITNDTLALNLSDIMINKNDTNIGSHVMLAPGKIAGTVWFNGKPQSSIHVFIPGTSFGAWTDDLGNFNISQIPPGTYEIRIEYPDAESKTINNVMVIPDSTISISKTSLIYDSKGAPPAPEKISASYDNSSNSIQVIWDSIIVGDLQGYSLYRQKFGEEQIILNQGSDPSLNHFIDSLGWVSRFDSLTIVYQVKAVDTLGNESIDFKSSFTLKIPPFSIHPGNIAVPPLTAHWNFEQGSGDTLFDRSGNNNHGKINGATWQKEKGSGYLKFDGIDDKVIFGCIQKNQTCWTPNQISMEVIFSLNKIPTVELATLFFMMSKNIPFEFVFTSQDYTGGVLVDTTWIYSQSKFELTDINRLTHAVYVMDMIQKKAFIYIDGNLVVSTDLYGELLRVDSGPYNNPSLGGVYDKSGWLTMFQGDIHDLTLYDGILADSTVNQLFKATGLPAK